MKIGRPSLVLVLVAAAALPVAAFGGSAGKAVLVAADVLTALLTVDTDDSGLNSDTLDGVEGAAYARQDIGNTFAASNTYPADDITDADVSNTLTASKFVNGDSVSDNVDLATSEANGVLDQAKIDTDVCLIDGSRAFTGAVTLPEIATPSTPGSGGKLYVKSDNKPYFLDDGGAETDLTAGGGGGTVDGTGAATRCAYWTDSDTITGDADCTTDGTDWTYANDVNVNGGDLKTSAATGNLFNATATTVNVGGAATTMATGKDSTTAHALKGTVTGSQSTSGTMAMWVWPTWYSNDAAGKPTPVLGGKLTVQDRNDGFDSVDCTAVCTDADACEWRLVSDNLVACP